MNNINNKIKPALTCAGLLLLILTTVMALITNFNFGIVMSFGISFLFLLYGLFFEKMCNMKRFTYTLVVGLVLALCLMLFLAIYGRIDNVTYDEDALIILGSGIKGERVPSTLARRLDMAVTYHKMNPDAVIVVTGGLDPQEHIPEALAMENYLLNKGIQKDKIIKESSATSTYENFVYTKEILDIYFNRHYTTAFITNDFHIFRAARLSEIVELNSTHAHAGTDWYVMPQHYTRECVAIIKLLLLRR